MRDATYRYVTLVTQLPENQQSLVAVLCLIDWLEILATDAASNILKLIKGILDVFGRILHKHESVQAGLAKISQILPSLVLSNTNAATIIPQPSMLG